MQCDPINYAFIETILLVINTNVNIGYFYMMVLQMLLVFLSSHWYFLVFLHK